MNHQFHNWTTCANGSGFGHGTVFSSLEQSHVDFQFDKLDSSVNGFEFNEGSFFPSLEQPSGPSNFAPFYNVSSEVDFPDDHESYPVLKYINQMLMEENMEEHPSMCFDPLALQASEKSFYEVLGKNHPLSPDELLEGTGKTAEIPDGSPESSSPDETSSNDIGGTSVCSQPNSDSTKLSRKPHHPLDDSFPSSFQTISVQSLHPQNANPNSDDGQVGSFTTKNLISHFFSDSETILQFKKGLEEGSKFLPTRNQLIIDVDKYTLPLKAEAVAKGKDDEKDSLISELKGRMQQYRDESDLDRGRSKKQFAVYEEEVELLETFDRLVLYADSKGRVPYSGIDVEQPSEMFKTLQHYGLLYESNVGETQAKMLGTNAEALDLSELLMSCAHSVAADDCGAANEQLKFIRQHASCTGSPHQRLAVPFANALEARLTCTGPALYGALNSKLSSTAEELKAYRVYLCAPFRQIFSFFANKMIREAASKATTLHIVDFGISYGLQWPSFIQQLPNRAGGPPKLRITGIDLPQPGFRPAERIEQTGRRLAQYCQRFNVPFEYQAIASRNWDRISIEELKLARNEVLAVNCQLRFKNLLDDQTLEDDNPKDAFLSIIRKMNPDIFVSDIINGQFGGPFFLTRFREALFFFYSIFDLLDHNLPRQDKQRLKFEQEVFGAEVTNVIACEGSARVERPETYKQWLIRYKRAGFRPLSLDQDLMKELKSKVKEGYHNDFMFDEDGCWVLQGWKGRIITACSCWIPA